MRKTISTILIFFMTLSFCILPISVFADTTDGLNVSSSETNIHNADILSYQCVYDVETKKVNISGAIRHDASTAYSNHSLLIYSVPPGASEYDVALNKNVKPLVEASVSMDFKFSIKVDSLVERYYKYAVFLCSPDGEIILASAPKFAMVSENKNNTEDSEFKGISTSINSLPSEIDAGTVVIPVYLDTLYTDNSNGYIYQSQAEQLFFKKEYIDELDSRIFSAGMSGARIYLQLLLRENAGFASVGEGDRKYIFPDVYNESTIVLLHCAVDFLSERYSEKTKLGFVLGKGWDDYLQYNYCEISSFEEYAERCGFYTVLISNAARSVDPEISIVLPFTGDNFISDDIQTVKENCFSVNDLLSYVLADLKRDIDNITSCSVMMETDKVPLNISNQSVFEKIDVSVKDSQLDFVAGRQIAFSNFLKELSLRYNGVFNGYIFVWTPPSTLTGNALAAAYAYSYYQLLQDDNVLSFVVELSSEADNIECADDISYILKYIDTSSSEDVTKNLLRYFEAESWETLLGLSEGSLSQEKYRYTVSSSHQPPSSYKGEFLYFDFSNILLSHGWSQGANCDNIKVEYSQKQKKALKAELVTQNKAVTEIAYKYERHENMVYTPYLDFCFMIEDKTGDLLYEVTIVIENGNERFETSYALEANKDAHLVLDLSSYSTFGMVDNIKILVNSLQEESVSANLWLYGISGYSTQYSDDELRALILEEREKIDGSYDNIEESVSYNSMIIAAVVIVLSAALITFVTFSFRRSGKNGERSE